MSERRVLNYYNNCDLDYRVLWRTRHNFSMHYGYFDNEHTSHNDAVQNLNKVLADATKVKSSDVVLDAGCGVGGSAIWLARNIGCKVTGINISPYQINKAKEFAHDLKIDGSVDFVLDNYLHTSFPSGSFSVIWAIESMCHADNKEEFITEAKRLLGKRGKMIIADGFIAKSKLSEKETAELGKVEKGWALGEFLSIQDFQELLKSKGFYNIRFVDMTANIMPSSKRMYIASFFAYPSNKILKWLGLRNNAHEGNILAAYHQYRMLQTGAWKYGFFYAEL